MRAWVWVAIIAWVLFMVTYVWGLARASSREMPPYRPQRRNYSAGSRGGYAAPPAPSDKLPRVAAGPGPGEPDRPWQPDPSRFGRCPSCGTLRPLDDGLIADHDRPEPQVPFNVQTFPCRGAGQAPMQPMETER
jgi:hypothetical protein